MFRVRLRHTAALAWLPQGSRCISTTGLCVSGNATLPGWSTTLFSSTGSMRRWNPGLKRGSGFPIQRPCSALVSQPWRQKPSFGVPFRWASTSPFICWLTQLGDPLYCCALRCSEPIIPFGLGGRPNAYASALMRGSFSSSRLRFRQSFEKACSLSHGSESDYFPSRRV